MADTMQSPRRQSARLRRKSAPVGRGESPSSARASAASGAASQEPNEAPVVDNVRVEAVANDTESGNDTLVDYQDTKTWPSWAHQPHTEIGLQVVCP